MNIFITFIIMLIGIVPLSAQSLTTDSLWLQANEQYSQSNFNEAAQLYEQIIAQDQVSADLYFNLGNAYYKQNMLGKARINYERALRLAPDNEDIITNIQFAKNAQLDKLDEVQELQITEWLNNISNSSNSDVWAILFLSVFAVSLILFVIYMLASSYRIRQFNFFASLFCLLLCVGIFFFGQRQRNQQLRTNQGVIISPMVTSKASPDLSGADLFIVHEGLKVQLIDQQGSWVRIKLSDGKSQGWVPETSVETI